MSEKDKWVRRFSVDETAKHNNGFTIYKITSVLFPIDSPEAVTIISVWKRYSDVQRLHKEMKVLHAGLHLRGKFPSLSRGSYFKRFHKQVVEERAKSIKTLLEFIAEHRLLFASTDFVNFLQTGYPAPEHQSSVINAIRSSLHLPIEETPPLEYLTSDDDSKSPRAPNSQDNTNTTAETIDNAIPEIQVFEPIDVEYAGTPSQQSRQSSSFESLESLESINSDLFDELNKITIDKAKPSVKNKSVLPDLINFDLPSTSKFDDYHTMTKTTDSDTTSINSTVCGSSSYNSESRRSSSRLSLGSKRSVLSSSDVQCKTRTEDSYVFEAGYMLNLAARCEDIGDYQRAFECYKSGIEKMLIGVQTDSDPQRRALIKDKTNKYLSYAEAIYKNHLSDVEQHQSPAPSRAPLPPRLLRRPHSALAQYRVLAVLDNKMALTVGPRDEHRVIKVIQKIPNNLTEFDEYFLRTAHETKTPILPTNVPYMVMLDSYIETDDLIFLILSYAPGGKLFDYIKNYVKSAPTTPSREINLENVFSEPKQVKFHAGNINIDDAITLNVSRDEVDATINKVNIIEVNTVQNDADEKNYNYKMNAKTDNLDNIEISVNELVINSQKLLLNVDKVLNEEPKTVDFENVDNFRDTVEITVVDREAKNIKVNNSDVKKSKDSPSHIRKNSSVIPAGSVRRWGAEILVALESLHNGGVYYRDLHPDNVLLGDNGHVLLTYCVGYEAHVALARGKWAGLAAPETWAVPGAAGGAGGRAADCWGYGALMYQLLCGVPLSYYHAPFTSHTVLHVPDGVSLEAKSLLTQLLSYEPTERLGCGKDGIQEIKHHPYFKTIDWDDIYDSWTFPD